MLFGKPYKMKGLETLKNTEKKNLIQRIFEDFPAAQENINVLISMKNVVSSARLTTHDGESLRVYLVDGEPQFIESQQWLVPTVYALWRVPSLVPTLIIHSPVLGKLLNGAPLYQPGVVVPPACAGFPMFSRGSILAVCTTDNASAAAVGIAATSSADMMLNLCGVCLEPVHVVGDLLCKESKFSRRERPPPAPAAYGTLHRASGRSSGEPQILPREEWPALSPSPRAPPSPSLAPAPAPSPAPANTPAIIPTSPPPAPLPAQDSETCQVESQLCSIDLNGDVKPQEDDDNGIPTDMDGLLKYCLLCFLKYELKKVELPLKTNLLYRNHLIPLCPPDRTLDVKKSSYKKVGKFLDAMQKEGLIEVRELERGVDAVTAACPAHPAVRALPPPAPRAPGHPAPGHPAPAAAGDAYRPPQVREMYCVTAAVLPLFPHCKKGTPLQTSDIRMSLTDYVKSRSLSQRGAVCLDPALAAAAGRQTQEILKWEELMSCVQSNMTACTEMTFSDGTRKINKSRLEPVQMQVVTRSGNKKVTLVSNLESFGFSLPALSRRCQASAAAACGVTRAAGARHDQLMLQGDQTYFVAKLLIEKYGLPKKFVEGADKALKKKNK